MSDYTVADIKNAMVVACPKCTKTQILTGVAISLTENTARKKDAVNHNTDGSNDLGPWQINSVHGVPDSCRTDLVCSTQQAYKISSGFKNWKPWTTYTSGAYRAHLSEAEKGAKSGDNADSGAFGSGVGSPTGIPNPLKGLDLLATAVEKFVEGLFSGAVWFRVGKVLVGLFLGAAGLIVIIRKVGMPTTPAGVARKLA
jgi:hypothetical protein